MRTWVGRAGRDDLASLRRMVCNESNNLADWFVDGQCRRLAPRDAFPLAERDEPIAKNRPGLLEKASNIMIFARVGKIFRWI